MKALKHSKHHAFVLIAIVIGALLAFEAVYAKDAPRMTKEELQGMLGNPDLRIVDVRLGNDWTSSEFKIKGAIRENARKLDTWSTKYEKDQTIVLYCA